MRYAILADIHGNLEAFRSVLQDIDDRGDVDEFWCLGDIVGYGPEPSACLALLREYPHVCVAGNHDWAAVGRIDTADFNPDAAAACKWTAGQLSAEDKEYLQNLPLTATRGEFTLAHGSPRDPLYEYIFSALSAAGNFQSFGTEHCLVGHTHVPAVFSDSEGGCRKASLPLVLQLGGGRLIVNPGGVGQPRDGDPRASYAIYDEAERVIYSYRISYDIASVQKKMIEVGLPEFLSTRLSEGQ
jgi:diadenosine tetraphosphatase ApaH/serine/threonine PP2A family protein phosphatase